MPPNSFLKMQTKNIRRNSAALFFAATSAATFNVVALSMCSGRLVALVFGAGVLLSLCLAQCTAVRLRAMARPVQWSEREWPAQPAPIVELRRAA